MNQINNMGESDSVKIARVDQNVANMERNLNAHLNEDTRRFELVFNHFDTRLDKFETKMNEGFRKLQEDQDDLVEERIDPLWEDKNKRDGAINFGSWVAGIIGGVIVAAVEFLRSMHGGSGVGR